MNIILKSLNVKDATQDCRTKKVKLEKAGHLPPLSIVMNDKAIYHIKMTLFDRFLKLMRDWLTRP